MHSLSFWNPQHSWGISVNIKSAPENFQARAIFVISYSSAGSGARQRDFSTIAAISASETGA